jgi:hypothetical protein
MSKLTMIVDLFREPTRCFLLRKVINPAKLGVQLERNVGKVLFSSLRIQGLLEPQEL